MACTSILSLSICFLVLFHGCSAQLEQVAAHHEREQRQQRAQLNECQLNRINALEPQRRIESENGVTEIWDENDEQFQCAGVVAIRHIIREKGLLLPHYNNGPKLVYVEQGSGLQGAVIAGCPETFQSSEESRDRRQRADQHQKVRQLREGDVLALPEGVAEWVYNDGSSNLVLVQIIDTSNPGNQLDEDFRKFFLAGNPPRELQSQRAEYRRAEHRRGERERAERGRGERGGNIFAGFDERLVAEAFNINTDLARRLQNPNDSRGIIIRVERDLQVLAPQYSREEQGYEYERERERRYNGQNGVEETFCTARLKHNINDPSRADVYNPRAGRVTTVNSHNLPILRYLRLSAQKGVLYRNALAAPHWNINAHSINYFTRGRGRVQIVGDNGQTVFDGEVREGQILTAPQNFVTLKKAGSEGLEWISFKTNDNAETSQLAGRLSALRSMPDEVVANAYQVSRDEARRIKNNREEVTLFSPGSRSEYQS